MHRVTRVAFLLATSNFLAFSSTLAALPTTITIPVYFPPGLKHTTPFVSFSSETEGDLQALPLDNAGREEPADQEGPLVVYTVRPADYCKVESTEIINLQPTDRVDKFTGVNIGPRAVLTSKHPFLDGSLQEALETNLQTIEQTTKPFQCGSANGRPLSQGCIGLLTCDLKATNDYALCSYPDEFYNFEPFAYINASDHGATTFEVQSFGCKRTSAGQPLRGCRSKALNYFTSVSRIANELNCTPTKGEVYLDYPGCPGDSGSPVFTELGGIDSVVAVVSKETCDSCTPAPPACTVVVPISLAYVSAWQKSERAKICGVAGFNHSDCRPQLSVPPCP